MWSSCFADAGVEFVIVGAFALAFHGRDALLKNKVAAARPKDMADVARLSRKPPR
jgi:hypothetical protein